MYLDITIFTVHISCCFCYVNYEMFKGFEGQARTVTPNMTTPTSAATRRVTVTGKLSSGTHRAILDKGHKTKGLRLTQATNAAHSHTTLPSILPVTAPGLSCYEAEEPTNIGTYEVPSQRDLVQLIRTTLVRMFNAYREKTMYFLKDIQDATKATSHVEKECYSHKARLTYRQCVKRVSTKCELITKILVISLERQRLDVSGFIEGKICNVSALNTDPMQLIKTLAMEDAALEFALPSFLRLLGQCSVYCDKKPPKTRQRRPMRHMTDQELVVRHFLSKKTYKRILEDTKTKLSKN